MKVEVEIDWELADIIVTKNLMELLDTMEQDLYSREQGTSMAIFEHDKKEDIKLMKKHIKAMKLVLKYYTGEDL